MESKYVLVVCPVLKDGKDFGGNAHIGSGEFIQARTFSRDGDIEKGLYGVMWGKCSNFVHHNILKFDWSVIKTEINENLIYIDKFKNQVKFKRGLILHKGGLKSCADYIFKIKDDDYQLFSSEAKTLKREDILATEEWHQKQVRI